MRKIGNHAQMFIFAGTAGTLLIAMTYYLGFYKPSQEQLAYQRDVECSGLVSKAETATEMKTVQALGSTNGFIFGTPKSHFSKSLNTCLGSMSANYSSNLKGTQQTVFSDSVFDVVHNKELIHSQYEYKGSEIVVTDGLSRDEYKQQEENLMSR